MSTPRKCVVLAVVEQFQSGGFLGGKLAENWNFVAKIKQNTEIKLCIEAIYVKLHLFESK